MCLPTTVCQNSLKWMQEHNCAEGADIWAISGAEIGFHRLYSWGFQGGS